MNPPAVPTELVFMIDRHPAINRWANDGKSLRDKEEFSFADAVRPYRTIDKSPGFYYLL
jgi:hypothetical protein